MTIDQQFLAYRISDNKALLQLDDIYSMLQTSYWAKHRSKELIAQSLDASLCVGVYHGTEQVGFLRAVTDGATFSWICDVIVHPEHRGKGIGKRLMQYIVNHPQVSATSMLLGTRDAHGLYEQYGFIRREMMIRRAAQ